MRQLFFAWKKNYINMSQNELDVLKEFKLTEIKYQKIGISHPFPNYYQFDLMFKLTNNPDYYNSLPMQTTQAVIKSVLSDFKSFFTSLKEYRKHPDKYTGTPKLPGYKKSNEAGFIISNQDAVIYFNKKSNTYELKLPKTKLRLNLGLKNIQNLKQVVITPYYDTYKICIVYEYEHSSYSLDKDRILGIDYGVDNFITTNNNCGLIPFIIKGKGIKSFNQWFNKRLSQMKSCLSANRFNQYNSKALDKLYKYRNNRTMDFYNKVASYIVNYCLKHNIGVIVIGKNEKWKTNVNLGKGNNQNFCFLSHSIVTAKIKNLSEKYGITVYTTEESYTSKSNILNNDILPSYKAGCNNAYPFTGKRIYRGLYITNNNIKINADVNGAGNIIRKIYKDAFKDMDLSYMYKTVRAVYIN